MAGAKNSLNKESVKKHNKLESKQKAQNKKKKETLT